MSTAGFETFGASHLTATGMTLAVPAVLSVIARRATSGTVAAAIGYLLAGVLLVNEVSHWAYRLAEVGPARFAQNHLPLHVCGLAVLLTSGTLLFRNQRAYEVAFFWGLVGSLNAVITPALEADFPQYRFFQYFIAHSGIVAGVLFATWGLGMRPTLGGLFRAFLYLHLLAAVAALFNQLLGSNYMYLSEPPRGTASPFLFAPWPWYIAILDALALALFFAVLSPFLVTRGRLSGWLRLTPRRRSHGPRPPPRD